MSQIESRAAAAAAALRGLDVGGGGVDDDGDDDALGGDGGDDDVRKPLSKKEKEKLKKQRAKERAKERAKAAAEEEEEKAPAEEAPALAQNAKKGGGGKAAALLAKAKRGEANKRDEAVRFQRAHTRYPRSRFPRSTPLSPALLSHVESLLIFPGPRRRAKRGVPQGGAAADGSGRRGDARGSVRQRRRRVHRWWTGSGELISDRRCQRWPWRLPRFT